MAQSLCERAPPPLVLDHITVAGLDCVSLIEVAARCGYDAVSLWVDNLDPDLEIETVRIGAPRFSAVTRALRDNGVFVNGVEYFGITGEPPTDDTRRAFETAAELGARAATLAYLVDLPHARNVELTDRMADMAAEFGLALTIEVMAASLARGMPSLSQALATIADVGRPNVGLTFDMLHLTRTGATAAEVAAVPASLVSYIQLCDGPFTMPADRQRWEAGYARLLPGEGEFTIGEYLAALPEGVPTGLEAPRRDLAPEIVAQRGMAAMRATLAGVADRRGARSRRS